MNISSFEFCRTYAKTNRSNHVSYTVLTTPKLKSWKLIVAKTFHPTIDVFDKFNRKIAPYENRYLTGIAHKAKNRLEYAIEEFHNSHPHIQSEHSTRQTKF